MARIRDYDTDRSGDCHYKSSGYCLIVCEIAGTDEDQRRHAKVLHVGKDRLLRERHIIVCMVLRRGPEKSAKMLAGSVIAWNDKVGTLCAHFCLILRVLKRHLRQEKVLRVGKALRCRTDKDKIANLRGIAERKVESNIAAMGTGYESGLTNLAIMQEGRHVVGLEVWLGCCGRVPVSSAVVTNGMELLAEGGPYVIPDSGIDHAVVEQDNRFRSTSTFLVIESRPIDLYERSGRSCGACSLSGQRPDTENREKQQGSNVSSHPHNLCLRMAGINRD